MIEAFHLAVADPAAVREMLRLADVAGPWADGPGEAVVSVVEHDGLTTVGRGVAAPPPPGAAAGLPLPATVVGTAPLGAPSPPLFPVTAGRWRPLEDRRRRGTERLLVVRETGDCVAAAEPAGDGGDAGPRLVLGTVLSAFLARVREELAFDGHAQLVALLRWWLRRRLDRPWIGLSPWRRGRPPCLPSFDVEATVGRRSLGRRVWRLPPAGRPLVELTRLDLVRPLRGRRLVAGRNVLRDPDGTFVSRRLTIDLRRTARGRAAARATVPQLQLQLRVPRPPEPRPVDDPLLHEWLDREVGAWTGFYCGGYAPSLAERREVGFHGRTHAHFHRMSPDQLGAELAAGRILPGRAAPVEAVRAPGLLWSPGFLRAVGEAGYRLDSSFRGVSVLQPCHPIRTTAGWWELPVVGNLLTLPLDRVMAAATWGGGLLGVHCHDHDVTDEASRRSYLERLGRLDAAGWARTGHLELVDWLEASRGAAVRAVRPRPGGRAEVRVAAPADTAVVRHDPAAGGADVGPMTSAAPAAAVPNAPEAPPPAIILDRPGEVGLVA